MICGIALIPVMVVAVVMYALGLYSGMGLRLEDPIGGDSDRSMRAGGVHDRP